VAHAAGLLHLDLQPANLLIPPPATGQGLDFDAAKVKKLGLSRLVAAAVAARSGPGPSLVGTPGYMAPELAMVGQRCGTATDVFSLGAVLYAMLTGHAPFEGKDLGTVVLKTAQQKPPPIAAFAKDVSTSTLSLVARCLEKDPARRFPDAGALLFALEVLRPDPVPGLVPDEAMQPGSLDTAHEIEMNEQFVSLLAAFELRPPSAGTLRDALDQMLDQALAYQTAHVCFCN
jgi:serine/threonine protein kinase